MSKVGADDLIAAGATVADFESLPRVEVDLAAACARGPLRARRPDASTRLWHPPRSPQGYCEQPGRQPRGW